MAAKSIFEKLNAALSDLPTVSGPNIFTSPEYAKGAGIGGSTARERLRRLVGEGVVRRVNTRRDGKLVSGWEFLGEKASGE